MIPTTYATATAALLALLAFKQDRATEAARVYPTTTHGIRSTQQAASVTDVVNAANAFLATLSSSQQSTVLQTFNSTNVVKWSNLPTNLYTQRIGLTLGSLTSTQLTAALALLQAATGTTANEGYDEIQQVRAADDNLNANGGGAGYGSGLYYLAFLGTPSTTGTWMLQYGGHHMATNLTYSNGTVAGSTPKFEGVEPLSFTTANANVLPAGTTYAPMSAEQAGMLAMIQGLSSTQQATAKLSQTFMDVVLGAQQDGKFPATKVGLPCSQLTSAQQALVMAAMAPWVKDADDATAASLLSYYQSQLASTYIAYAGTGNFTSQTDYARIDGPNVWIEFACQGGIVYQGQIHYHTIWRDRARDYGGNFYGTYTTALGTKDAAAAGVFSAYPNPVASGQGIDVVLATATPSATYSLRNTLGQQVAEGSFSGLMAKIPTTGLAAGVYLLSVQPAGQPVATSRLALQ